MNRQSTSPSVHKLMNQNNHQKPLEMFNDDYDHAESGDPEFYQNGHTFDDDIYDFSHSRPTLNLESSSNNPTDDEEDGKFYFYIMIFYNF